MFTQNVLTENNRKCENMLPFSLLFTRKQVQVHVYQWASKLDTKWKRAISINHPVMVKHFSDLYEILGWYTFSKMIIKF